MAWDEDGRGAPDNAAEVDEADATASGRGGRTLAQADQERLDIFDAVGSPIIIMDPQHRILDANRAAREALDMDLEEIRGRCCWELFHGTGCAAAGCPMDKMLASHSFQVEVMPMEAMAGTFLVSCTPIFDSAGELLRIIHVATDISEQRRLEERLARAQKLEALGCLAGGIAHDFNNQLSGIMGYAELLDKRVPGELRRYTEGIMTASTRAADLTEKLLDFARRDEPGVAAVDLHRIVCEVADMLARSCDRRIRLVRRLEADRAVVRGNATDLQNAILNLGINARDAMAGGGELVFSTDNLDLPGDSDAVLAVADKLAPGAYLRLLVRDTGEGISPEILAHVFEPFFTTKKNQGGTGMGLASVYATIRQHRGSVDIRSRTGKGTTVELLLPLAGQEGGQAESSDVPGADNGERAPLHVLVVDDEEYICDICADMLRELGHQVTILHDGKKAVEYFRARWRDIDLVLLDMRMPKMTGDEVFDCMRRIDPHARVLMFSGFSQNGAMQELLDRGAAGFLRKPFRFDDLRRALRAAVPE